MYAASVFGQTAGQSDTAPQTQIQLTITMLGNNGGWLFEWPSTGASYYRIVLFGHELGVVVDVPSSLISYTYEGAGYFDYPPPLEVVEEASLAASELNKPYITIQWYGLSTASYYIVEEYLGSEWSQVFHIGEINAGVYTWVSERLNDSSTHLYRVTAYNSIDQSATPLEFDIEVVTPPNLVESLYELTYDDGAEEFTFDVVV